MTTAEGISGIAEESPGVNLVVRNGSCWLESGSKPTLPSCCHTRSRALARSPLTLAVLGCW